MPERVGTGGVTPFWIGTPGSTQAATNTLAIDSHNVYWADAQPDYLGQVLQQAKGASKSQAIVLADNRNGPTAIAVDDANVYWTEWGLVVDAGWHTVPGQILACAIGGCNGIPTVVAPSRDTPVAIAVDAHNLYWTERGADSSTSGKIVRLSK